MSPPPPLPPPAATDDDGDGSLSLSPPPPSAAGRDPAFSFSAPAAAPSNGSITTTTTTTTTNNNHNDNNNNNGGGGGGGGSPSPSVHPCTDCSRRKVKCDRGQPCGNCVRYGRPCRQPDAGREPRRPRRARDSTMFDRVRNLERSLEQMRSQFASPAAGEGPSSGGGDGGGGGGGGGGNGGSSSEPLDLWSGGSSGSGSGSGSGGGGGGRVSGRGGGGGGSSGGGTKEGSAEEATSSAAATTAGVGRNGNGSGNGSGAPVTVKVEDSVQDAMGRLIIDEKRSRYVSGTSWSNLADEVDDLKTLLEDEVATEGVLGLEDSASPEGPTSSSDFLPVSRADAPGLRPSAAEQRQLWEIFLINVEPLLKVIHVPSTQKALEAALVNPQSVPKSFKSLIASINFSAICSMCTEQCLTRFGQSKWDLLRQARYSVKVALKEANFLLSQVLDTLKAFIIFLVCNRRHEEPRISWILCGIAFRLGQALGMHRDGEDLRNLSPFCIDERRRLWWAIRMLDAACAEDCGFAPTQIQGENTKIPLNINDRDLGPGSQAMPQGQSVFTDMTYSLVRFEICKRMPAIQSHMRDNTLPSPPGVGSPTGPMIAKSSAMAECQSVVEAFYFPTCSADVPLQRLCLKTGQMILAKMTLLSNYPKLRASSDDGGGGGGVGASATITPELQEQLLDTSCRIVELGHEIINDPELTHWSWFLQTYMEWHPVAYLLHVLCSEPLHAQRQRAWRAVNYALGRSHGLCPSLQASLWLPLRKLFERAKAAAEGAGAAASAFAATAPTTTTTATTAPTTTMTTAAAAAKTATDNGFPTSVQIDPGILRSMEDNMKMFLGGDGQMSDSAYCSLAASQYGGDVLMDESGLDPETVPLYLDGLIPDMNGFLTNQATQQTDANWWFSRSSEADYNMTQY